MTTQPGRSTNSNADSVGGKDPMPTPSDESGRPVCRHIGVMGPGDCVVCDATPTDESIDLLDLDPQPSRAVPCCMCGRFTSTKTARRHTETGDYGHVYSVEFECRACAEAGR